MHDFPVWRPITPSIKVLHSQVHILVSFSGGFSFLIQFLWPWHGKGDIRKHTKEAAHPPWNHTALHICTSPSAQSY